MIQTRQVEEWKYIILHMAGVLCLIALGLTLTVALSVVNWVSQEETNQENDFPMVKELVQYCLAMLSALVKKIYMGLQYPLRLETWNHLPWVWCRRWLLLIFNKYKDSQWLENLNLLCLLWEIAQYFITASISDWLIRLSGWYLHDAKAFIFLPITKFVISNAKIRADVNCGTQVNQFLACLKPVYDMKRIIINC